MKKSRVLLVIAVLLVLGVVLFVLERRWQEDEEIPLWSMVPESAALVYETTQLPANWEKFQESTLNSNLQSIDAFQQMKTQVALMDSLANVKQFFTAKQILIATHVISKDAFDFSYYFKVNSTQEHNGLTQALRRFEQQDYIKKDSRTFNGFRINELTDTRTNAQFSYIYYRNIFVGSFTPFLIEDVVRNIETKFTDYSFLFHNSSMEGVPKLADDEGNLYLNTEKLPLLLSVFTTNDVLPYLQPLARLSSTIFLDVNLNDNQLLLNGFSKVEEPQAEGGKASQGASVPVWLSTFKEEEPQTVNMYNYVPERTAVLYHFGTQGGSAWLQKLYEQQSKSDDKLSRQTQSYRKNLSSFHGVNLKSATEWFKGEMGLMVLESIDPSSPDKVMVMETQDTAQARVNLRMVEAKLREEAEGIGYSEKYAGYEISEISYKEFPAALVGPVALGFDQCFYLITDRYVIFANSIRALKRLIADHEAENTWDKSIQEVRFLESALDKSNVSVFFNTSRSWKLFQEHLSPKWKSFSNQHSEVLKSFNRMAVQFSHTEDDFYTSLAISYSPVSTASRTSGQFSDVSRLFVDATIQTKPYVVRDHTNQTLEVLFQDEAKQIYLAELDGSIIWKDSLPGDIIGEVYQVDYFKNGKLQYLFATDSAIHLIDRTGSYVSGYPSYMPEGVKVKHLSLIDYDNSKNYRFLISDTEGRLWMYNKDRENLEGWNPNPTINSALASAPFHTRVGNKDFIIVMQQNGDIYGLNRRGQPYAGFPIQLDKPLQSEAFTDMGSKVSNTVLTTVSQEGEIISFNLQGNITKREQLYRPTPQTRFKISADALGKTFIIVRQDEQLFGILDRTGKLLFEKNYMSSAAMDSDMLQVQYYDFGAGNEVFAVTDKVQEFTYLFTRQGMLIKDRPIESRFPVGILYYDNDNRFQVFRNFENEFSILSFSK
ncbi:DUF3352 domain-containing protein [Porifericola rhodea]|uniref:DUF3352 domain-containing protein n=1 Tax=Porifericola rhodea TaxID=930972 RepID=UPI0026669ED9|nr:DUF3352 domain-containing protein [Porifericola rhodea]WKN29796.1 DUF3352 domain-containing protein [Porifericola rhodea]